MPSSLKRYAPYLLGITLFTIYLSTTAPTVYLGDSGELTAAAFSLGIPHNSGYPLYSMLGKLFCLIPMGNIGFRVNLMSALFSVLTIVILYSIIFKMTVSVLSSVVASIFLAFTQLFWFQTVSAEVYPLHTFFVALLFRMLLWWDQTREFRVLVLFVFLTGLSFGNHMQTVMLAPAVLFLIISGDKKVLFDLRNILIITVLFMLALTLYVYLPVRTNAGAAIHWGDPNTFQRFWDHVTAQTHRGAYVFSVGFPGYMERFIQYMKLIWSQWGILCAISFWGWLKLPSFRWKLFCVLVVFFDFIYTVFLNIITFQVTPFGLPTLMILTILLGVGLRAMLARLQGQPKVGAKTQKAAQAACMAIPLIMFVLNVGLCNQNKNYSAYEHAVNIFRTAANGDAVFMDADNNVFPVTYGRIVEKMGEGVVLQDRHNVIFRWKLDKYPFVCEGSWKDLESAVREKLIKSGQGNVYFSVFEPNAIDPPTGYHLAPFGVLKAVLNRERPRTSNDVEQVWDSYSLESFERPFNRDYMNREVAGRYHFWRGEDLWQAGKRGEALGHFRMASSIAYDDTSLHSDLGVFFSDKGLFEEARKELEKALIYNEDKAGVQNNWGYYYHKKNDYENAIKSFKKAILMDPGNTTYLNNLGFTLYSSGKPKKALDVFRRSLSIQDDQPEVTEFMRKHHLLSQSTFKSG